MNDMKNVDYMNPIFVFKMFTSICVYILGIAFVYGAGYFFLIADNNWTSHVGGTACLLLWLWCNYKFMKMD